MVTTTNIFGLDIHTMKISKKEKISIYCNY